MVSETAVVGNGLLGIHTLPKGRNSPFPSTPAPKAVEKLLVTSPKQKDLGSFRSESQPGKMRTKSYNLGLHCHTLKKAINTVSD